MEEKFSIKNNNLLIEVKKTGAELCSIKKLPEKVEYLWDANPAIWAGYSPILFPIVGALKETSFFYKNKKYYLAQHGFFRKSTKIKLVGSTPNSLNFRLCSDNETLEQYPFHFEFEVNYTLKENSIKVNYMVRNIGDELMYFSLGAHPAFKCPVDSTEKYTDYYIEFHEKEEAYTYQILEGGLIGNPSDKILENSKRIDLHYNLFNKGALVFKSLKSRSVCLVSKQYGKRIQLDYEGFPFFGIWAKPSANYVCLEPWLGIADSIDSNQQLANKEGIISIGVGSTFSIGYTIQIF